MPLLNRKPFKFGPTNPEALGLAPEDEVKVPINPSPAALMGASLSQAAPLQPPEAKPCTAAPLAHAPGGRRRWRREGVPPALRPTHTRPALAAWLQVFVVKATGEVFRTYEAYLKQIELYRQAVWSCRYSGKGGLTLEEAQEAERKAVAALQAVSRAGSKAAQRLPARQFA